jgi:hypothetical protein
MTAAPLHPGFAVGGREETVTAGKVLLTANYSWLPNPFAKFSSNVQGPRKYSLRAAGIQAN